MQVHSMGGSFFSVNGIWYPGSIFLTSNQVFLWDVENADEITEHSLDILEVLIPRPVGVLIGTGDEKIDIDDQIYEKFEERYMKVDVVSTVSFVD